MKRIGVLRGGKGKNYETSLIRGGDVIMYLIDNFEEKYKPVDILIDTNNVWHLNGLPVNPADLVHKVDLVWNVAATEVSSILQSFSIPHIGNSTFTSSLEGNRDMLVGHLKNMGVKMPRRMVLPVYQEDIDGPYDQYVIKKAKEVHEKFGAPWIVRSFNPEKSMGIHVAKTFNELVSAIDDGVRHEKGVVIEEFIDGRSGSSHSVAGFRGDNIYIISPTNLNNEDKKRLASLVKELHKNLGVGHYLKSDFVIHPKRGVFLKDISFHPDLREGSHLDESAKSVGAKMHHIVEHIIESIS